MCAVAQEPRIWKPTLLGQQHFPCSGGKKSRSTKSAIMCGNERFTTSVSHGSTSSCGIPSLNWYRVSPQGRPRFIALVACYCFFLLIRYQRQKSPAGAVNFLEQNQQRDQQRLSTLFSGTSQLSHFEGVAAAFAAPVLLHAAAGDEETAEARAAENGVSPTPADVAFYLRRAAIGRPSRCAAARRNAVLENAFDVESEIEQVAEDSRALQQYGQETRKDEEGERVEEEATQEGAGLRNADTHPTTKKLQQLRGEENGDEEKKAFTQVLERFTARIPRKQALVEKLKFLKKASVRDDDEKAQEQSSKEEASVQRQEGSTALNSSVNALAPAVNLAAHQPTEGGVGELDYVATAYPSSLHFSGVDESWAFQARAGSRIKICRRRDQAVHRRRHRVSPRGNATSTVASVFWPASSTAAGAQDGAGAFTVAAASMLAPSAYTVGRRLGAVPHLPTILSKGDGGNAYSHSSAVTGGKQPELLLLKERGAHASGATGIAGTPGEDFHNDGAADSTVVSLTKYRKHKRRRKKWEQPRGLPFEPEWNDSEEISVGDLDTPIGNPRVPQRLPHSEVVSTSTTSTNTRMGGLSLALGTNNSHLKQRGGLGSSVVGGVRIGDWHTSPRHSALPDASSLKRVEQPASSAFEKIMLEDASVNSAARGGISSAGSVRALETVAALGTDTAGYKTGRTMPNPVATDAYGEKLATVPLADGLTWQQQQQHKGESEREALGRNHGVFGDSLQRAYREHQKGKEDVVSVMEKHYAAMEDTMSTEQLLQRGYIVKPLRNRQRAAVFDLMKDAENLKKEITDQRISLDTYKRPHLWLYKATEVELVFKALFHIAFTVALGKLTANLVHASIKEMPIPFPIALLVGWLVMKMGQKVLHDARLATSAVQLLLQDLSYRRRRLQVLMVADALHKIAEQDERAQGQRGESEKEQGAEDNLTHAGGNAVQGGKKNTPLVVGPAQPLETTATWM